MRTIRVFYRWFDRTKKEIIWHTETKLVRAKNITDAKADFYSEWNDSLAIVQVIRVF